MDQLNMRVVRARQGDGQAREQVVQAFEPLIYKAAAGACPNPAEREDARQEGYLAVLDSIQRYDATLGVPFAGYVKSRVYHAIRNYVRKQTTIAGHIAVVAAADREQLPFDLDWLPDQGPNPEQSVVAESEYDRLIKAVDKLPPRQRRVIQGIFFEQLPLKMLAAATGTSLQAVHQAKKRGLHHLATLLVEKQP